MGEREEEDGEEGKQSKSRLLRMTRNPSFSTPRFRIGLIPIPTGWTRVPSSPILLLPIRLSSLLPLALQNTAMPSAKVSRCTSPK